MADREAAAARPVVWRACAEGLSKLAVRAAVALPGETRAERVAIVIDGVARGDMMRVEFERARAAGLVEPVPNAAGWRLSAKGRDTVRRLRSGTGCAVAARGSATTAAAGPGHNPDESPLAWLRRRRGKDGEGLISEQQFAAGERLRADFWFAQMTPRVTASWDGAMGAGGGRRGAPGVGVDLSDNVVAAAERVRRALAAVGPEFSGILVDVCCHLKGLESWERAAGWPLRSGKVVLRLALSALARHYGLSERETAAGTGRARTRHWGGPGYRPGLDGGEESDQAELA